MPQGFLKKIKFNLLLPNLAFKFDNAAAGFRQRIGPTLFSRQCKTVAGERVERRFARYRDNFTLAVDAGNLYEHKCGNVFSLSRLRAGVPRHPRPASLRPTHQLGRPRSPSEEPERYCDHSPPQRGNGQPLEVPAASTIRWNRRTARFQETVAT
ncbi:MAG: hypothetical protein E5X73_36085 [Mesorhizobium sp.]|nr:MAG: hypothetical protein E5X73_36085 [Mesorhizobium sp.]